MIALRGERARDALAVAALIALFAVLCGPYLLASVSGWRPGGWDGTAHHGVAELYARDIFPSVSGWLPEYFAGMPFPDFYPPGFYFLVALLTRLGLSTTAAFSLVQVTATFAVPLLVFACGRRLTGARGPALASGALAAIVMMDPRVGITGISLVGTFGIGLSTQLLAACFVLAFYFFLLRADEHRGSALLAALFLALVALTNVHMVWVAAALYLPLVAVRVATAPDRRVAARRLGVHAGVGALAVALSAIWVLPMLDQLAMLPTSGAQRLPGMIGLGPFVAIGACAIAAGVLAALARRPAVVALAISTVGLAALAAIPWWRLDSEFPLQFFRCGSSAALLAALLVGGLARTDWPARLRYPAWGLALAGAIALSWDVAPRPRPNGRIPDAHAAEYREVLRALGGRTDGRVLVENGRADPRFGERAGRASARNFDGWFREWEEMQLADMFALQGLVGASGAHSLTTVFREASPTALFAIPTRNGFSQFVEGFGVDGELWGTAAFTTARPLADYEPQLRLFDLEYFVVRSDGMKRYLDAQPGVARISAGDGWVVYRLDAPSWHYAEVPRFEPMLAFAPLTLKSRPSYGFDFIRLGEEMYARGRLDVPLAHARRGLDDEPAWERFGGLVITDHACRDVERAFARLEAYSRDRPIVALEDDAPLYARLAELARERTTIRLVPRIRPGDDSEWMAARRTLGGLLDAIDQVKRPLAGPVVTAATLGRGRAEVVLDRAPAAPVPVLIKQTYFPRWRDRAGAPIYLVTPTFQLVFTDEARIELRYQRDRTQDLGAAISGLAALGWIGLGVAALRRRRRSG